MVGRRSLESADIQNYIKGQNELKIESKTIFNEMCKGYGDNAVSYRLVRKWIGKFNIYMYSIQDTSRSISKRGGKEI